MKNRHPFIDEMLLNLRIMKQLDMRLIKQQEQISNVPLHQLMLIKELTKDGPITLTAIKNAIMLVLQQQPS